MKALLRTLFGLLAGGLAAKLFGLLGRFHVGPAPRGRKLTTRRTFTRNAALGAVGIVTAEIAAGVGLLLWPNRTGAFGGTVNLSAESVPEVGGEPFRYAPGKFYLVHTDDGLEALYWKCVHLGCTVPWVPGEERFVCPCHGSVYTYDGARESGPAPRPLDAMPITVNDDGSIAVNTNPSTLIVRDEYLPAHAVPYNA